MKRLLDIWRAWSLRKRLTIVGALALVTAGGALAAYFVLKRDGDEGCAPNCPKLTREKPKKRPPPEVETVNWAEYGYDDARTRYLPSKLVSPPFKPSEWSWQAGKLLEFSPIVYDESLYVMDFNAEFYSLDKDTGKVEWTRTLGTKGASSPSAANGQLFGVTLEPGTAFSLDAESGRRLWSRELPGRSETSPLVHGKKVYVGSESGEVFALNRNTGAIKWQVSTGGPVKGGLAFEDGVVYAGNYAGELYALDAGNGDVKWQNGTQGASFGRTGSIYSTPAVAYGRVFVGSIDGRVYSFEQDSGALVWSHSTGAEVYPAPAVAEVEGAPPTVFVGSADQNFYALDAEDGSVRWQQDVGGVVIGAASVVGDTAYVGVIGDNIGTFGFDAKTGKKTFEHEFGEYNPVISDGEKLYLTGYSGIRAFEPADPKKLRERRQEEGRLKRRREAKREARGASASGANQPKGRGTGASGGAQSGGPGGSEGGEGKPGGGAAKGA
ncbi:MAG: PQQ-binding-like beta-propeller repeat protein [Solirubrobacterales bacterium]|nr:PQQ-binding-like beta-propeller repeat protein [Solirubrobacterales bacterium]